MNKQLAFELRGKQIQMGLELSYRKLLEKKAKEGGSLILSINGEIKAVPAIELLKDLKTHS